MEKVVATNETNIENMANSSFTLFGPSVQIFFGHVIAVSFTVPALFMNGLAIFVITKSKFVPLISRFICAGLSLSYLLSGLIYIYMFITIRITRSSRPKSTLCVQLNDAVYRDVIEACLFCVSCLYTMALSADRVLTLRIGLRYKVMVDKFRVSILMVFIWVFSLLIATTPIMILSASSQVGKKCINGRAPDPLNRIFQWKFVMWFAAVMCVLNIFANMYIYRVASRHRRQIAALTVGKAAPRFAQSDCVVLIASFVWILCVLPPTMFFLYDNDTIGDRVRVNRSSRPFISTSIQIAGTINPIVYVVRLKMARLEVRKLFGFCSLDCREKAKKLELELMDIHMGH